MKKTAIVIFLLGTLGVILMSAESHALLFGTHWMQMVIVIMGMECCSLLPLIIESEEQ